MSCLQCDLAELMLLSMPPDADQVDLIERAFLAGQIDSRAADMAYLWLLSSKYSQHPLVMPRPTS